MRYNTNIVNLIHLQNVDKTMFCGDIHGDYPILMHLLEQKNVKNCIVFICGDGGVGFFAPHVYMEEFRRLNKRLVKQNIYFAFTRGNHDYPVWFDKRLYDVCPNLVNKFDRWIFIEDYSIIKTIGGNVLCVGGARSIDRLHRKKDADYWEEEVVRTATEDEMNYLLCGETPIDIVVTHQAPDFYLPFIAKPLQKLTAIRIDDDFNKDNLWERKYLSELYEKLMKVHKIKYWFHGHLHKSYYYMNEHDTKFYCLDINELKMIENYE